MVDSHMHPTLLVILLLSLAAWPGCSAEYTIVKLRVMGGTERLTYDSSVISASELERLVRVFSPNADGIGKYVIPPGLESCINGAREYRPCGSKDPRARNFLANARVNLEKGKKLLDDVNGMQYPPELKPIGGLLSCIPHFWALDLRA